MYYKSNSYNDAMNAYTYWVYSRMLKDKILNQATILQDYGPDPFIIDLEEAADNNNYFRDVYWTGNHLQLAVMSLNVGEDIGAEMHPNVDQFVCIVDGEGFVAIGDSEDNLTQEANVTEGIAVIIPAGKWHNITNIGNTPLKLYTIYAPPAHPFGTVHKTKKEAE